LGDSMGRWECTWDSLLMLAVMTSACRPCSWLEYFTTQACLRQLGTTALGQYPPTNPTLGDTGLCFADGMAMVYVPAGELMTCSSAEGLAATLEQLH
jgi:hypothetical protein